MITRADGCYLPDNVATIFGLDSLVEARGGRFLFVAARGRRQIWTGGSHLSGDEQV